METTSLEWPSNWRHNRSAEQEGSFGTKDEGEIAGYPPRVVSGGGRIDKPILKAGNNYHKNLLKSEVEWERNAQLAACGLLYPNGRQAHYVADSILYRLNLGWGPRKNGVHARIGVSSSLQL